MCFLICGTVTWVVSRTDLDPECRKAINGGRLRRVRKAISEPPACIRRQLLAHTERVPPFRDERTGELCNGTRRLYQHALKLWYLIYIRFVVLGREIREWARLPALWCPLLPHVDPSSQTIKKESSSWPKSYRNNVVSSLVLEEHFKIGYRRFRIGECFSQSLSWYLLSILSGHSFEDRAAMTEGDFSFLPEEITFSDLTTTIIGIQDMDNLSEQCSFKDSCGSQQTGSTMDSDDK
ncbi:unnamed protein product [Diatraea saccharalis]|uniref:Uncharacterized protein n=1 Tax=Diatraea saccharalis TaxID=40085 RepID=A0A9N9W7J3_9NEOP|nr:unnamed protein product [Diatraea saccharalis]